MPEGFETYRRNKLLYQQHMQSAAKRAIRQRTTQIWFGAIQMVGFDTGALMSTTQAKFKDGGLTGVVKSGGSGAKRKRGAGGRFVKSTVDYAAHHHFPGVTRNWAGNPYLSAPFNRWAPQLPIDIARAHNTFRPILD